MIFRSQSLMLTICCSPSRVRWSDETIDHFLSPLVSVSGSASYHCSGNTGSFEAAIDCKIANTTGARYAIARLFLFGTLGAWGELKCFSVSKSYAVEITLFGTMPTSVVGLPFVFQADDHGGLLQLIQYLECLIKTKMCIELSRVLNSTL